MVIDNLHPKSAAGLASPVADAMTKDMQRVLSRSAAQ
jgi:hypothetical protein